MSRYKGNIPKWIRRFRRSMLFTDLMTGRKVIKVVSLPDGTRHSYIEVVDKPIAPEVTTKPLDTP